MRESLVPSSRMEREDAAAADAKCTRFFASIAHSNSNSTKWRRQEKAHLSSSPISLPTWKKGRYFLNGSKTKNRASNPPEYLLLLASLINALPFTVSMQQHLFFFHRYNRVHWASFFCLIVFWIRLKCQPCRNCGTSTVIMSRVTHTQNPKGHSRTEKKGWVCFNSRVSTSLIFQFPFCRHGRILLHCARPREV